MADAVANAGGAKWGKVVKFLLPSDGSKLASYVTVIISIIRLIHGG